MRNAVVAIAVLAGGLLLSPLLWSSAQATSVPNLTDAFGNTGVVTPVGRGRGGGGGGGWGGGGGGRGLSLSGGGSRAFRGSSRAFSSRSFSGGSRAFSSRTYGGGSYSRSGKFARADFGGSRKLSSRNFDGRPRHGNNWKGDNWKGDNWKGKNFSKHDRNKFSHLNRHRVFRNGVWIWAYGPGYYAYNDCYWLRRQAIITGDPYWWNRYNACRYGYY